MLVSCLLPSLHSKPMARGIPTVRFCRSCDFAASPRCPHPKQGSARISKPGSAAREPRIRSRAAPASVSREALRASPASVASEVGQRPHP